MKQQLMKFAKQDLKIARVHGSVLVSQCKVFGKTANVTINKSGDRTYDILWATVENGEVSHNHWKSCNEKQVVYFLLSAYDVVEVG